MNTRHRYLFFAIVCALLNGPLAVPSASASIPAAPARPASSSIRAASSDAALSDTRSSALDLVASIEGSVTAVGISGTLAYIGAGRSLVVLDIGNPAQPNRLARLTFGGWAFGGWGISDLQVAGDRVYLITSDGTLRIVDIRDPLRPTLLSTHDLALSHIEVIGNLAYTIVQGGSLRVFDVSNPLDLRPRGSYAPASGFYALDMQVVGGLAYVVSDDSDFQVVDLRDPSHPRLLGRFFDRYFTTVSVAGTHAYLIRIANGFTYLDVIDISQPSRPKRLGSLQMKALRDLQAAGSLVYAVGDDGLHVIDMGQPAAPREIGTYPIGYAYTVEVAGNQVYVLTGEAGLQIIDVSNPALPTLRGRYAILGFTNDVQIVGSLAYIAAGSHLQIFDLRNSARPIPLGSYFMKDEFLPGIPRPIGALRLQVRENLAYVMYTYVPTLCCQVGGVEIIDLTDPTHPVSRGKYENFYGGISDIQVSGQRIYLTGAFRLTPVPVLSIVDASNPANPTWLGNYDDQSDNPITEDHNGAAAVDVAGSFAYVADYSAGLKIIDVSNPASPTLRSRLDTPGSANDIQIAGDLAYIADGERGLLIGDISNPISPTVRGSMQAVDNAVGIRVVGDLAYIAAGAAGVQVVDVSDPTRPIPRGRYDTPGYARSVDVAGDLIYVADQSEGLQILKLGPLPSVSATIPPGGGTLSSPADATTYTFATGTFGSTVAVTHTIHFADGIPPIGSLAGGHAFDVVARDSLTGQLVQPSKPYSITIHYDNADKGPAIADTLALYFWDGARWVKEPSSLVDTAARTVSAMPSHFSTWALLGETRRAYLPESRR